MHFNVKFKICDKNFIWDVIRNTEQRIQVHMCNPYLKIDSYSCLIFQSILGDFIYLEKRM